MFPTMQLSPTKWPPSMIAMIVSTPAPEVTINFTAPFSIKKIESLRPPWLKITASFLNVSAFLSTPPLARRVLMSNRACVEAHISSPRLLNRLLRPNILVQWQASPRTEVVVAYASFACARGLEHRVRPSRSHAELPWFVCGARFALLRKTLCAHRLSERGRFLHPAQISAGH